MVYVKPLLPDHISDLERSMNDTERIKRLTHYRDLLQDRSREALVQIIINRNENPVKRYCAAEIVGMELVGERWRDAYLRVATFRVDQHTIVIRT